MQGFYFNEAQNSCSTDGMGAARTDIFTCVKLVKHISKGQRGCTCNELQKGQLEGVYKTRLESARGQTLLKVEHIDQAIPSTHNARLSRAVLETAEANLRSLTVLHNIR
jgi:hypothetical protein